MTRSWLDTDRGTRALPKQSLREWLVGFGCVAVIVGAMVLADLLGRWAT